MAKYIDAVKLKSYINSNSSHLLNSWDTLGVLSAIDEQLAADVQDVKHGRWLQLSNDDQDEGSYWCSECNTEEFFSDESLLFNYCPNCGAKMDGKERNNK